MANLQIKGIKDELYAQIKNLAASENRSVSQQVLFLIKEHLSKKKQIDSTKRPALILLELSGSWEDDRKPEDIVKEIKKARKNSMKLDEGF
jgi:hypothetical protein